jgi:DNA-binding transcriptional MerR regulator
MNDDIDHPDQLPVYNIKAVSRLVDLLPVTLRAWERRYGFPSPLRGDQGYRLYSEYDLRTLRWLKSQVESGLSIGRAVQYLTDLRRGGQDPAASIFTGLPFVLSTPLSASPTLRALSDELLDYLLHFNEAAAGEVLRRSFALHAIDEVLFHIVSPVLVKIGEMWHQGRLPIAVEHYASQFAMQQLMGMLAGSAPPARPGLIVAACAPGETHQIGIIILVVLLRWRGWDVRFLGPDLQLDRLEEALRPIHPTLLMFTANRPETASDLAGLPAVLARFPNPKPLVVVGGQAFTSFRLPESVPVIYINSSPEETVKTIENLLLQQTHPGRIGF